MSKSILVPLDGSALAEQALPTAVALADRLDHRLELAIVHETEDFHGMPDAPWNAMSESMQNRYIADKAIQLQRACHADVRHATLRGDVAEEICNRASATQADMIVMSSRGLTGLTRALSGSVADAVIRGAGIPVLLVRTPTPNIPMQAPALDVQRVLILVDGSERSHAIVGAVDAIATTGATRFTLLEVIGPVRAVLEHDMLFGYVPDPVAACATDALVADARAAMAPLAANLAARTGCSAEVCVLVGDHAVKTINDFAQRHSFDLLALTTHGRGASRFLLGSVTDQLLQTSPLPMLVLSSSAA